MKRTIYTLLVMLLVCSIVAMGQIKPIKKPNQSTPKTEKTAKTKHSDTSNNSGKSGKNVAKQRRQQESATKQRAAEEQRRQQESAAKQRAVEEQRRQQESAAKQRIIQQTIDDMVWVEGGTFTMGASAEQGSETLSAENPTYEVTLSGYYISKYEVTKELWQAVMGNNPSDYKGDARLPVGGVSWDYCQEFIRILNKLTGKRFRLPTEAEWEFAARGGNKSRGYIFSGSDNLSNVAWYDSNSGNTTHPVGQKSPNELGLYDMSGNVWEWCQDWYDSYICGSQMNPTSSASGSYRVYRGGSWLNDARCCRVSRRNGDRPSIKFPNVGLRLAL